MRILFSGGSLTFHFTFFCGGTSFASGCRLRFRSRIRFGGTAVRVAAIVRLVETVAAKNDGGTAADQTAKFVLFAFGALLQRGILDVLEFFKFVEAGIATIFVSRHWDIFEKCLKNYTFCFLPVALLTVKSKRPHSPFYCNRKTDRMQAGLQVGCTTIQQGLDKKEKGVHGTRFGIFTALAVKKFTEPGAVAPVLLHRALFVL